MIVRKIPSSGEEIPIVGLGTWQTFDVSHIPAHRAPLKEVLKTMFDLGGRIVDSSPMYGRSEKVVGDLARDLDIHKKLFTATKVWTTGREEGIKQMNASIDKMQSNPIDLIQVHNMVDCATHLKTLRRWKEEGKVRYIGITHYNETAFPDLIRWIKNEPLDFVQFNYSIIRRDAEKELFPLCQEKGVATLINLPFETGSLFRQFRGNPLPEWADDFDCRTWGQFFLKFILGHPGVTCVIPGTSKPRNLVDNMRAGMGRLPDEQMRERMADFISKITH